MIICNINRTKWRQKFSLEVNAKKRQMWMISAKSSTIPTPFVRLPQGFLQDSTVRQSCKIMPIHLSSILLSLLQFTTRHSRMLLGRQQSVLITAIISDKQFHNKTVSDGAA